VVATTKIDAQTESGKRARTHGANSMFLWSIMESLTIPKTASILQHHSMITELRMLLLNAHGTLSYVLVAFALALALILIIRRPHKLYVEQKAVSKSGGRKHKSATSKLSIYRIVPYTLLVLGLASLPASAFYSSYVLAFMGLGLTFWGALLLYLTPSKYVKVELLNATAISNLPNIERILSTTKTNTKGIYLSPKHLKDYTSSLIFIPAQPGEPLPTPEETDTEKLHSKNPNGIFLTPPGLGLSKLFEKKLGKSFTETDLEDVQKELPKLFEKSEITKNMDIQTEENSVTVDLGNHIFKGLCEETRKLEKTHETVGCPLSSAIACALAKASGKPVTIEKDTQNLDGSTRIQYKLLED
jgi:hypothetical protein